MSRSVIIIGSGFAGLSAASFMAKAGWKVTIIEKNDGPGGRARQLKCDGFTFDMGPSWYWMPDVFERYFQQFGKNVEDYYSVQRLDPSYRIYWNDGQTDLPANLEELKSVFESIEPGSSGKLEKYLKEAAYKYNVGIKNLVYKPGRSVTEFLDWKVMKGFFRLDVLTSMKSHIEKHFKHPKLRQIMEFPILFLGALPENTPALYSLMNYADICGGTWYPKGGMYSIVDAMYKLAIEVGVEFHFNEEAEEIIIEKGKAGMLRTSLSTYEADVIISGADYNYTETSLLPLSYRTYSDDYWNRKKMAPSCLLYYVGLNKKLRNVQHHSLFFDVPFSTHAGEIYENPSWPSDPLFYLSVSSVTDPSVSPPGCENMVFLVPVASGLKGDSQDLRQDYFQKIAHRMEMLTGEKIMENISYWKSYSLTEFSSDYNSFKGNAYGLANTLTQTALLRPSCKSKKVSNLFFTGQLTVPGPGVPPSLISGEVVAKEVLKSF